MSNTSATLLDGRTIDKVRELLNAQIAGLHVVDEVFSICLMHDANRRRIAKAHGLELNEEPLARHNFQWNERQGGVEIDFVNREAAEKFFAGCDRLTPDYFTNDEGDCNVIVTIND